MSSRTTILFDLDGTLVDTHFLIHRCLDESLFAFTGQHYPDSLWRQGAGKPLPELFSMAIREFSLDEKLASELVPDYRERLERYESEVQFFDGIEESLEICQRRGFRLGLVTTKLSGAARRHLQSVDALDKFECIVAGDMVTNLKPDPEPFLLAIETMQADPAACFTVGDSPGDIIGAHAAGIQTIAAEWGCLDTDRLRACSPHHWAESPQRLQAILQAI